MADYFTNFSFMLWLPNAAAQSYALQLAGKAAEAHEYGESPTDFPPALLPLIEDWHFETGAEPDKEKHGLWLSSSCGGIDAVCGFIQHLLQKYQLKHQVAFEWSFDCTKPRVDAYGGGAALVTARRVKTMTTAGWLEQQRKKGENR